MEFYLLSALFLCRISRRFNSQRDGILPAKIEEVPLVIEVSIPNGMEFYGADEPRNGRKNPFQFPTGWNSTNPLSLSNTASYRFNSQRDGILPTRGRIVDFQRKFQFPTGWNSTEIFPGTPEQRPLVSIPNGMEFYKPVIARFDWRREFQFPTGWNSTHRLVFNMFCVGGFNSQRDGILLCRLLCYIRNIFVSIPNGMEFYYRSSPYLHEMTTVSIPNGMEFYGSFYRRNKNR